MRGMLQLSIALAAAGALVGRAGETASINPRLTGAPLVRTWTAEDYGAAPVSYDLIQHPDNGFIYVANDYGVLEFDGATWRLVEMPNGNSARALAVDPQGRIFVGGGNEIALLAPDSRGILRATSLLDRLPTGDRSVGAVNYACRLPPGSISPPRTGSIFSMRPTACAHGLRPSR
jgi:hypothetical protein